MREEKRAHMKSLKFPINRRSWWITQTTFFFSPHFPQLVLSAGGFSHAHVHEFCAAKYDNTFVTFVNGETLELPVSISSFENQVYRTAWLRTKFIDRIEGNPMQKKQEFMLYPKEDRNQLIYEFILRELKKRY